jgi:hypothetical protein
MATSYRVIQDLETDVFYVQKKCGIIFKKWEYVDSSGDTDGYYGPIEFDSEGVAFNFMLALYEGRFNEPKPTTKIVAWIGDKE